MTNNISQLAEESAIAICNAFDLFHKEFKAITHRSKARFEGRDWMGAQKDAAERLDLYKKIIDKIVVDINTMLGDQTQSRSVWVLIKKDYSELIVGRHDFELAETFLNSVTRKI